MERSEELKTVIKELRDFALGYIQHALESEMRPEVKLYILKKVLPIFKKHVYKLSGRLTEKNINTIMISQAENMFSKINFDEPPTEEQLKYLARVSVEEIQNNFGRAFIDLCLKETFVELEK